jgi:hypothetical protein
MGFWAYLHCSSMRAQRDINIFELRVMVVRYLLAGHVCGFSKEPLVPKRQSKKWISQWD